MSVSSGNLDALIGTTYAAEDFGGVAIQSYTQPSGYALATVNVTTTGAPGPGVAFGVGETLAVGAVNDATNTIALVLSYGGSPVAQFSDYVIGFAANSILLGLNSATVLGENLSFGFGVDSNVGVLSASPIPAGTAIGFSSSGTDTAVPACYCPGTMIRTERGDIAIERLAIGDRVVTRTGAAAAIRWIGRRAYAGRFLRGRAELLPIRIKAGALARGVPYQDLVVSPAHALLLDGYLVPASELLNDRTIVREPAAERVDYLHIELAEHDVIFANGAAAETFVDDDSRAMFSNAAEYDALYPEAPRTGAVYCAPRLCEGDALEAIRARLAPTARPMKRPGEARHAFA